MCIYITWMQLTSGFISGHPNVCGCIKDVEWNNQDRAAREVREYKTRLKYIISGCILPCSCISWKYFWSGESIFGIRC